MQHLLGFAFQTGQIDPLASIRVIMALVCVIVASSLALGVAVGLTRRIQEIAGPDDQAPRALDAAPAPDAEQGAENLEQSE